MPLFDVIFVLPYPFADHPSFPEGILKRALETAGFSVGVIETPFWQSKEAFSALGRPRLFFAVISGPVDSVVLNYTSLRKRRREDLYQFGGRAFFPDQPASIKYKIRPDRTLIVFSNRLREAFRDVPIVIGGVEGTLRRFTHFDFQEQKIRRSILLDSRADLLVCGPGEKQLVRIARILQAGTPIEQIIIPGTARAVSDIPEPEQTALLPAAEEIQKEPAKLLEAVLALERLGGMGKKIAQRSGDRLVLEQPAEIYTSEDLDFIYDLDFSRSHLQARGCSPALQMNLFSITAHRGCGGACAFCSITQHEGRRVVSRSLDSVLREVRALSRHPLWKGVVSDMGGASAEMYGSDCLSASCSRVSCVYPESCGQFRAGEPYLRLLHASRSQPGVKKVFIGSGVRHDLVLQNPELLEEILLHHAGRFLRIAPEHTEEHVLRLMRKPSFKVLEEFVRLFRQINSKMRRPVELLPYLIIGHPGETFADVREMRKKLKALGLKTSGTQIFTPSPGTLSTAMFHAGISPSGETLAVARDVRELQRRKDYLA